MSRTLYITLIQTTDLADDQSEFGIICRDGDGEVYNQIADSLDDLKATFPDSQSLVDFAVENMGYDPADTHAHHIIGVPDWMKSNHTTV